MRHSTLVFVCAGLCFVTTAIAQQPRPSPPPATPPGQPEVTFKAEVNYVDVDVVVTDQQGNLVRNLTKDDFEVREDGKPQKVEMFSYVDLPIEHSIRVAFGDRIIPADVRTNQQALAGRLYVLVLDDLDTSLFRTATVKRTARQFIERSLGPNDVAAVVYTSGRTDAAQDFTSDPQLLLAAVDKFVGRKLRSAVLDKIDTYYQIQERTADMAAATGSSSPGPQNNGALSSGSSTDPTINPNTRGDGYPDRTFDSEDLERGQRALNVLEDLKDIADFMGNVHGRRKALLLFSEGVDYAMDDIFGSQDATLVMKATQDAITAAARGNVSIFGIDPRGLIGMSSDAMSLETPGPATDANAPNLSSFAAEMRLSQDSLRALAEETGGFSSVNANDPAAFFDRIVKANSTYYVLGYYPPSHPRDGRFHKIEVRVKGAGLKVSARKGYADPRGKTPEERDIEERARIARDSRKGGADNTSGDLRAMLNSPMQQGGITMVVQAVPFRNTDKEASVALAIEMDTSRFHFEPKSNATVFVDKLELSYFSLNERSKPQLGTRDELELSLRPDSYQRAQQVGLRLNPRLALAPGRYQLRIGMRESGTGVAGTVFYDLQVPDFTKDSLSVSGMLITAGTSQLVPTLISDKSPGPGLLPGPATSRRTFAQGDVLGIYAEIYDNISPRQTHSIESVTRLVGEDGRAVFTSRETHNGATARAGVTSTTFAVAKQIPLMDVPPGRYLLQVEASARGPKDAKPITRETLLTIVPAPSR
ncbi:MAG TPA: VWA domain-containing protein [Vicinamibacterales bacterium]|jgi:VWFA-related protein|nr:VWA domain-containing protein [Vicinamibacterales bacterium]